MLTLQVKGIYLLINAIKMFLIMLIMQCVGFFKEKSG